MDIETRSRRAAGTITWAAAALLIAASPVLAVTVDGKLGAGEWDGAPVDLTDPDEATPSDDLDVSRIRVKGGADLAVGVETHSGAMPSFAPGPASPHFNFYFTVDGARRYSLNLSDNQMNLNRLDSGAWTGLGAVNWTVADVLEVKVDWARLGVAGAGTAQLDDYFFLYNMLPGDTDADGDIDAMDIQNILAAAKFGIGPSGATWQEGDVDGDGDVDVVDIQDILAAGSLGTQNTLGWDLYDGTLQANNSVSVAPEPVTLFGLVASGIAAAGYFRRRRTAETP